MRNRNILAALASARSGEFVSPYIYPPDAPVFADPVQLDPVGNALDGSIFTADLAGKLDVILEGHWDDGCALNAIIGSRHRPIRFVNLDANTLLGDPANPSVHGMSVLNNTDNIELWGKDRNTPLRFSAGTGQSGLVWLAKTTDGGTILRTTNLQMEDVGYAGILSNQGSGSAIYKKEVHRWVKVKGLVAEGEGVYKGNTGTPFSVTDLFILIHAGIENKGREGLQLGHVGRALVFNGTFKSVGQTVAHPQDHLMQVVDCNGIIANNIFDGAPALFNIFTHDVLFENNYFGFTATRGYIGRTDDLSYYGSNPRFNGVKQHYKNNIFHWRGGSTLSSLVEVAERIADIDFEDNVFVGDISALFFDNRVAGHSNSLVGTLSTNGNQIISSKDLPSYVSTALTHKDYLSAQQGIEYFTRRMGRGLVPTGDKLVCEVKEIAPIVDVPWGTEFGDLELPATAEFLIQDGLYVSYPVTWDTLDYDGETEGEQIITGTPTLPGGIVNTFNVAPTISVTVLPEPTSAKKILVNLGGTSANYVGSGNWNHVFQSFATGAQTIKGNNNDDTLASLRNTDGELTGYGISITSQFEGNTLGQDPSPDNSGAYPDAAIIGNWSNPGSAGTSRVFTITGLDNSKAYTISLLGSAASFLSGSSHLVTVQVSGASGGGTLSNQETEANINNKMVFDPVMPSSGVITITVTKTATGQAYVNVLEIDYEA
jgi:hypothetical protein